MNRKSRLLSATVVVTLVSTLAAGLERIDAGKPWQGAVLLLGAAIGTTVFLVRKPWRAASPEAGTESAESVPNAAPEAAGKNGPAGPTAGDSAP